MWQERREYTAQQHLHNNSNLAPCPISTWPQFMLQLSSHSMYSSTELAAVPLDFYIQ